MPKRERIKQKFPIFFAFGDRHRFLDADAAVAATPEARIRSIWPFLVRRVLAFQRTLKAREKANFDPEDTLAELYTLLFEKDGHWNPGRGKYITFAGALIDHELCAIRDRSRTVHSPRNSACRLKEYERIEAAGVMTERRRKTAEQVRRTAGGVQALAEIDQEARHAPDPADEAQRREADDAGVALVRQAIRRELSPFEAAILGMSTGLWGSPPRTIAQIAEATLKDPADVKRAKARAFLKLREFIAARAPSLAEPLAG